MTPSSPSPAPAQLDPSHTADIAQHRDGYLRILQEKHDGLAPLTEAQRAVLDGDITAEAALSRGAATVAAEVLDEAINALVRLDVVAVVAAHEKAMRYAKFRVRYVLGLVFQLHEAVQAQRAQADTWSDTRQELERRTELGRAVRTGLVNGLDRVVRKHEDLTPKLSRARGGTRDAAEVSTSLTSLADLLEAWLADPRLTVAMASVALDANDVADARAHAASIEAQRIVDGQTLAAPRDLPPTNLLEGRLVHELNELYRALHEGRASVPRLPTLVLGDTLRRAFGLTASAPTPVEAPKPAPAV